LNQEKREPMNTRVHILSALFLGLVFVAVSSPPAMAATLYLRPNTNTIPHSGKTWVPIGATNVWETVDDSITETQTPTLSDYMEANGARLETLGLTTANITGVAVTKATVWYYSSAAAPVEFKSTSDSTWQTTNTVGWHSRSESIPSQAALDAIGLEFRTSGSGIRQVPATFLKIETDGPKVYWGAWMDGDVYATNQGDAPWNGNTWSLFESHTGKKVSIVHFGQPAPWQQPFDPIPLELTKAGNTPSAGDGALPLLDMGTGCKLSKECNGNETVAEEELDRVSLSEINEGKYDSYYKTWAEAVAKYKYPFFFRWAWEMNGTWFKWGRDAAKNPGEYVQAWRRIHNIAVAAGASNITWVWCPNLEFLGSTPLSALYPGNEYVDWTCLDGYNKTGLYFSELFSNSYSTLTGSIAPSKPVMVGETATVEESGHHLKQGPWIREALQSLPSSFPRIKAFVWFNWNIVQEGHEWEWPIEWTLDGQSEFAYQISSSYFAGSEFGEPTQLQPIKPLP
jgi:hypothetical protein